MWDIKGSERSMLPSNIDQMKASQETGREADIGFRRALMPSYFGLFPDAALVQAGEFKQGWS